jgi:Na+-transporting methylmalonyl-CoA/oxaloacetate decarboxylase gamma subunit
MDEPAPPPPATPPPPRAFTQGVGLVFQFVGVVLFLVMFFICCGSSLLSKDWATRSELTRIGWGTASAASRQSPAQPAYSAQRALTISVFAGVFFGMALAGAGLGMQAGSRVAAPGAVVVTLTGTLFWLIHTIFAATAARSLLFALLAGGLTVVFAALLAFAMNAMMEMRKNPPPEGHDLLPPGYKIPYSHYHDDPPEVRLAAELAQRKERLAVQQKEFEALEAKIKRSLQDNDAHREQS